MATKHPISASFRPSKCCTSKLSLGGWRRIGYTLSREECHCEAYESSEERKNRCDEADSEDAEAGILLLRLVPCAVMDRRSVKTHRLHKNVVCRRKCGPDNRNHKANGQPRQKCK